MTTSAHSVGQLITPAALAARWSISAKTLANNRARGVGLPFVKVGGSVRYALSDIEAAETLGRVEAVA